MNKKINNSKVENLFELQKKLDKLIKRYELLLSKKYGDEQLNFVLENYNSDLLSDIDNLYRVRFCKDYIIEQQKRFIAGEITKSVYNTHVKVCLKATKSAPRDISSTLNHDICDILDSLKNQEQSKTI